MAWPTDLAKVPHHAGMAQARPTSRAATVGLSLGLDLALALRLQLVPDLLPRRPLPGSSGSLCPCSILSIELGQSSPVLRPLLVQHRHGPAALVKGGGSLGSHAGGYLESKSLRSTNGYGNIHDDCEYLYLVHSGIALCEVSLGQEDTRRRPNKNKNSNSLLEPQRCHPHHEHYVPFFCFSVCLSVCLCAFICTELVAGLALCVSLQCMLHTGSILKQFRTQSLRAELF